MRPWMINFGVSLLMLASIFTLMNSLQVSTPSYMVPQQGYPSYPFTPTPRYTPPPLTHEQIAARNYNYCVNSNSNNPRVSSDFVQEYCHCAENNPSTSMYAQCRIEVVTAQSKRSDLAAYFDQRFSSLCNRAYIEHDGRISEAKTPEVCSCMKARIQKNPMEAASLASIGYDNDNGKSINADRDQCAAETNAYQSTGWQVGERNGKSVAVIEMPEHHDIRNMILSCSQNQMEMRLEYWPNPRRITRLQEDADSYNPGWVIQFQNERAVGKQVSDFYRMVLDRFEAGGQKPGEFTEQIPDPSNNRDIGVLFGDFAGKLKPILGSCIPSLYGNMNLPAPTQPAPPSNALPDRWSYGGREANYNFPGEFDDAASLNYLQFSCATGEPLLGLGGRLTDDLAKKGKLSLSPAGGAPAILKTECGAEEGGTVCYARPSASLLKSMAGSNAIFMQVGDKKLGLFPFGGSPSVRNVLQYCKYESARADSRSDRLPPAAPSSQVGVGSTITLTGPMNLRAFPADDGRLLRKLPIGTQIRIVRKANDKKGNAWSAVTFGGQQEAGFMKDMALLVNIGGANASLQ